MEVKNNRRKRYVILILGILLLVVAGLGVFSYYFSNRVFHAYEVESQIERKDSNNVQYTRMGDTILKYSRSGINAMDGNGKNLWNGGFEMQQPQVDTSGNYVVVADITGDRFYVYNGEDEGTSIETTLPIVRAKISKNGMVAVLLQDKDSNVLSIYNPYSTSQKLLVEIPTNISEEGYPLDFDISDDGQSVVTTHMAVVGNTVNTHVNFYNFTDVGQDHNTLVGGKKLGETVVSAVEFMDEDTVVIFHGKGFCVYNHMKMPEPVFEKNYADVIKGVAYGDGYIGVVTYKKETPQKQTLSVYDLKGKEELQKSISYEFSRMAMNKDEIMFWSNRHCDIVRMNGSEKWNCDFKEEVEEILTTANDEVYTVIDKTSIKKIKLTRN